MQLLNGKIIQKPLTSHKFFNKFFIPFLMSSCLLYWVYPSLKIIIGLLTSVYAVQSCAQQRQSYKQ